jgi:hypothetical protein
MQRREREEDFSFNAFSGLADFNPVIPWIGQRDCRHGEQMIVRLFP